MGIDIYKNKDHKTRLFQITDELYEVLDKYIIDEFEKVTSVLIDAYGDSRISYQHSKTLLQLINKEIANRSISETKSIIEFIRFLERSVNDQIDLDLIGD